MAADAQLDRLRARITADCRRAESDAVAPLVVEAAICDATLRTAQGLAASLAQAVRAERRKAGGVDALMLEFSLDSREGIALMCLAEALLRIPDAATRDRLIRDKIGQGDWQAHVGRSPSLFVNAAAWGLLVTGKLVDSRSEGALEYALSSLLRKGGEPLIRKGVDLAMRLLGKQFVLGRTIEEALANAREREARGYRFSFDMLGEAALTDADARHYLAAYEHAIHAIGASSCRAGAYAGPGISIKLSALHPRYVRSQRDRVLAELQPRVAGLARLARGYDIGFNIDAEEADRLDLSLDLFETLAADSALAGWNGLGFVVQAYQKRARAVIDWLIGLGRRHDRRLMVRLVKGAYWDTEIKRTQVDGLPDYPVFTRKVHTDVSYLACAKAMLAAPDALYPQFASHNAFTIAAVHTLAGDADYEFQCLHGMGESIYDQLVGDDHPQAHEPAGPPQGRVAPPMGAANEVSVGVVHPPAGPPQGRVAPPMGAANEVSVGVVHPPAGPPQGRVAPPMGAANAVSVGVVHPPAGPPQGRVAPPMGAAQQRSRKRGGPYCRIYAPVGSHETLLAYLVRRLLENGANTSFVNRIVDPAVDIAELIADPVARARSTAGSPHPRIPLPAALYSDRGNSRGLDLSDEAVLRDLGLQLSAVPPRYAAAPILASPIDRPGRTPIAIVNPGDHRDVVGTVQEADADDVAHAVATAAAPANAWLRVEAAARADCLDRAADLLEESRTHLVLLAVREAGKTFANAVGEVREAADFCRYYAAQARRELGGTTPRGPMACIAPWNFPLAIFTGQISAALAAGNPVLAKPAEQTPLIAAEAVRIFHRAGIPTSALQMLPGRGETVGAALVADPRIAGVLFTGSTAVAQLINRTLANRRDDPVLIAETGGQNAMIVDSSALPEQAVADALMSAFDSAGQRCSALRVFCVQDDVADRVLPMLEGAMRELKIGDTRSLATDVGPVIDREAQANLDDYIAHCRATGASVFQLPLPSECASGTFVAPALIEIDHPERLTREVFGPVLHVVRFRDGELPQLIDALNAAGYGLTHGIQTRIDETVDLVCKRIRAGNIYVNRNIIGAVVGVQPFGGEALSGTGPKAGGPHYLWRLVRETPPPTGDKVLPGPTGETNALLLRPRGRIACLASTEAELMMQVRLATQLGNTPLLAASAMAARVRDKIGGQCVAVADPLAAAPDAVLFAGTDDDIAALRTKLAAQDGPLVPLIVARDGIYDATRLVSERTVTINTTASGGNASLLSLEEEEPA